MADERPRQQFQECCLIFPLLPGLYAWIYIKIGGYVLFIPMVGYLALMAYIMLLFGIPSDIFGAWVLSIILVFMTLVLCVTDVVANIVLLVKLHKENVKLIRTYYKYNVGVLIVIILLIVLAVIVSVLMTGDVQINLGLIFIVIIGVQIYFLLLLRSLLTKLESRSECTQITE